MPYAWESVKVEIIQGAGEAEVGVWRTIVNFKVRETRVSLTGHAGLGGAGSGRGGAGQGGSRQVVPAASGS